MSPSTEHHRPLAQIIADLKKERDQAQEQLQQRALSAEPVKLPLALLVTLQNRWEKKQQQQQQQQENKHPAAASRAPVQSNSAPTSNASLLSEALVALDELINAMQELQKAQQSLTDAQQLKQPDLLADSTEQLSLAREAVVAAAGELAGELEPLEAALGLRTGAIAIPRDLALAESLQSTLAVTSSRQL